MKNRSILCCPDSTVLFLLLFYSIMLRAVLGLFPYLGKDFYVL
ncbi:hypothetical protein HMPREF2738_01288 [Clostridiales bacterium KLE1615]|nr:hypothetical protein HMPREF2738_01288 [Clostridiales bacterium KLE1615]